jgi:hypothetical protein
MNRQAGDLVAHAFPDTAHIGGHDRRTAGDRLEKDGWLSFAH